MATKKKPHQLSRDEMRTVVGGGMGWSAIILGGLGSCPLGKDIPTPTGIRPTPQRLQV